MRFGLFLTAFVLAGTAMLTTTPAVAQDPCLPAGYLRSIQGQVNLRRGMALGWRPAALDEPLCTGDLIRVGERSRAEASFANLTQRIDQNTTLSVAYVPAEDKPSLISLLEGAVYFFSRKPRVLQVDTPYFDAGVEGTEFLVRVEPHRALLTVFDGRVTARNPLGEHTVTSGQSLAAEAGQAPAPYLLVRPRDAVQWALFYPAILLPLADRSGSSARAIAGPLGQVVELAGRGEFTAAFAAFEAIPQAERRPEFYLYRAAALLSVGQVEDARADIGQALLRDPTEGLAYALSAVIAVVQNDNERALEDARHAVELSPRSAAAKMALSFAEQAQFRIEDARETMSRAVEDEPENALAWSRLSELWLMQGYRSRSLKAAKKARTLAPDLERTETVLGFAALAAIDITKAKKAFRRAIELDSASPRARFGLGLATIRAGNLEEGRREIETAVALDPDDALLRSYLGKAYFDERTTNPLTYVEELVTNFPNQENTLAAEQFAIAKRLDPKDPTPWLYDAIREQSENRPIEALRDIEKSTELNDNRAVYRSRELLDQDQAARGTSLARIYNDLGFEQLGITEAAKSLSLDPSNAAAHRFLSDVYATQPRREIARISELLQAQLLQDININPVQPSLSVTNLNIITGGGPARPGFNEFTPLFERNQAQLNATGVIGNENTLAEEAVASGIYNNLSVSAGQFHYRTDGFRRNNDLVYDNSILFSQLALTPELNLQAEVRRVTNKAGDRVLQFNPNVFQEEGHVKQNTTSARFGARYSPTPHSSVLASVIYDYLDSGFSNAGVDDRNKLDELQGEAEYIYEYPLLKTVSGFGYFDHYTDSRLSIPYAVPISDGFSTRLWTVYNYTNIRSGQDLIWTLGASFDGYNERDRNLIQINPKFGIQWDILPNVRLRLAVFRTLKPPVLSSRSIRPTQVAGFNQLLDDVDGTDSWNYGGGMDVRVTRDITGGIEASQRRLQQHLIPLYSNELTHTRHEDREEQLYRAYVYWSLYHEWALSSEMAYDTYKGEKSVFMSVPNKVETWKIPISIRYFNPSGFFSVLTGTFVSQEVNRQGNRRQIEGDSDFFVLDATIGYRLPRRRGMLSFQAVNLLNTGFKYQDDSFREFTREPVAIRFTPERAVIGRVTLNF